MREFSSLKDFAVFLGTLTAAQITAEHAALERAAKLVEKRAKEKIGEYQQAAGPFAAWAELADATKADRARQGFPEDEPGLRTGEMRDSIEHQVSATEAQIGSDDDKLVWFELGTAKQPPRSVLGGAGVESAEEIVAIIGEELTISLTGAEVFQGRLPIKE